MDQTQFDVIVKIIRNGAPALAEELIQSLINLVNDAGKYHQLLEKVNSEKEKNNDAV